MGERLLSAEGLVKRYGGVVAVAEVGFELHAGEILGLVGPNGAGKTTLVDLITGAQASNAGRLELRGRRVAGRAARRGRMGLARTFQHPLIAPELTVQEMLVSGLAVRRLGNPGRMVVELVKGAVRGPGGEYDRAAALAAELGLANLDRKCGDLTLGQQRLVEVARALAQDPVVLLLDEPFAGADSDGVAGIVEAVNEVRRREHGVILVDHNVDLIASLADRVLLLDQGRVAFDGPPEACLASPEMRAVYFGGAADE